MKLERSNTLPEAAPAVASSNASPDAGARSSTTTRAASAISANTTASRASAMPVTASAISSSKPGLAHGPRCFSTTSTAAASASRTTLCLLHLSRRRLPSVGSSAPAESSARLTTALVPNLQQLRCVNYNVYFIPVSPSRAGRSRCGAHARPDIALSVGT